MKKPLIWVLLWSFAALIAVTVASFIIKSHLIVPASLFISAASIFALVYAAILLNKNGDLQKKSVSGRQFKFEKILIPLGLLSVISCFIWIRSLANVVPNTKLGVIILFYPSIFFLVAGILAVSIRVYIWLFRNQ